MTETVLLEVELLKYTDGTWTEGSSSDLPEDGIIARIDYPQGYNSASLQLYNVVIAHMFAENENGHKAGEVEYFTNQDMDFRVDGMYVKLSGSSPVLIHWNDGTVKQNAPVPPAVSESIPTLPKTGDNTPIAALVILMALSAVSVAAMNKRRMANR